MAGALNDREPFVARFWRNTNLSAASGALTEVTLSTTDYNDDAATYELTAISGSTGGKARVKRSGTYLAFVAMNFSGGSTGARNVQLTKNAPSPVVSADQMVLEGGAVGTNARPFAAGPVKCAANDELGIVVYVDGGTAVTLEGAHVKDIGLALVRIGP